jgi:hypothetical protein
MFKRKHKKGVKDQLKSLRASIAYRKNHKEKGNLSNFDACIEACDSLAASHTSLELKDCSILVSPDGIFMDTRRLSDHGPMAESESGGEKDVSTDSETMHLEATDVKKYHHDMEDEYENAVYVGYDLEANGEKKLNGFTW